MKQLEKEGMIPKQEQGAATNTTATFNGENNEQAKSFFQKVKVRLLDVNNWEKVAGFASADFKLCDSQGNIVKRLTKPGDHFRIDIPGPGSITGDGYDWVRVEKIDVDTSGEEEIVSITVRPASNPGNDNKDVAHFFGDEATSTFMIERKGNKITAGVYGRNEKPNDDAEKLLDKARNTTVAAAAITGFSKIQWKALVEGLVKA